MTPLEELQAELNKAKEELSDYNTASLKQKQELIDRITAIKNKIRILHPCKVTIRVQHVVPIPLDIARTFEEERDALEFIDTVVEDQGIYHDISDMETIFVPISSITYMKINRLVKQD